MGDVLEGFRGETPMGIEVPVFTINSEFTTFEVHHSVRGGEIVLHFYLPSELRGVKAGEVARLSSATAQYWTQRFPQVLDPVARRYFGADSPRLRAVYTEELQSWWLKAIGYDHVLDMSGFLRGFYLEMDAALDPLLVEASPEIRGHGRPT